MLACSAVAARGIAIGGEGIDQFGRTGCASQWRDVIAPVEIPLHVRTVADAQNDVGIGEGCFQQRSKSSGVGAATDTKIDVRGDDPGEGPVIRRGRELRRRKQGEGVTEIGEGCIGLGRIAIGMMLGG